MPDVRNDKKGHMMMNEISFSKEPIDKDDEYAVSVFLFHAM